ncbi:MAG: DUF3034 family protein [Phycisphaerae bacterium]|nr:DUF3034 family protein [Phycisphaerae bacterium]
MKNTRKHLIIGCVILTAMASTVAADEGTTDNADNTWLATAEKMAANEEKPVTKVDSTIEAPAAKAPPLPFHTIEGYGGGAITPMAYLINPGPEGTKFGLPSASFTFCRLGTKDLETFSITETLFRRFELGYAISRLGLGTLPDDVNKAIPGMDIRDDVYLHSFNVRTLLIEENSFGLPLPAITVGVHFKINDGIKSIDKELGGAFRAIGFDRDHGVDYTLTASKMFPKLALGRPVILTAGLRNSRAAQIGYLGFADHCTTTFEGSVCCLPTDQLVVAYEFRQKTNPYDKINGLVEDEDNWHAISASWIVNEHLTITGVYGAFGNLVNASADCSWGIQLKWEF